MTIIRPAQTLYPFKGGRLKHILFTFGFLFFSSAYATDLTGSYTGCGTFAATGTHQIYFHLVKSPTGFGPEDFEYTAAFVWKQGVVATFFPTVLVNEDQSRILMRAEVTPRKDYGLIVKAIMIQVLPDQSLSGTYTSNASVGGNSGAIARGVWTAKKVDDSQPLPTLNCK